MDDVSTTARPKSDPIRVVFFGTPAFAVPALRALADDERFRIVLVVTQPDRPAGRGRKLVASAVKVAAAELDLPVYQPGSLRQADARQPLIEAGADVFVVAAFGMIFGPKTLSIPAHGCINLHASILPAYRGAAPISAAIANRDAETGVSMMRMDPGLDTGPVLSIHSTTIRDDDTTASLTERLADLGAGAVADTLSGWVGGSIQAAPQPGGATLTRPLVKSDGWLDWSRPAAELEALVRAMWPWPRAWTTTSDGTVVQVHAANFDSAAAEVRSVPGTIRVESRSVSVETGAGRLRLVAVQVPGGKPVDAAVLASQGRFADGDRVGVVGEPARAPLIRQV